MDIFKVYWFHNKQLFVFHYQTIMLKCCLSLIILWRMDIGNILHVYVEMRWWPVTTVAVSAPLRYFSLSAVKWFCPQSPPAPGSGAHLSGLTGNEHARLDNADILGEISSSGYWELLAFMQFIGVSIFIEEDTRQAVCLLVGIRVLSPSLTFWQVNTCCREKFTKDFPQVLSVKFGKHLISTH